MTLIPKIYKRNYSDLSMLFIVEGQRLIMPAISIEKALYNYFKYIEEENYNIESALTTFQRLKRELYESAKTDRGTIKEEAGLY